jgi:hypothetical protein
VKWERLLFKNTDNRDHDGRILLSELAQTMAEIARARVAIE